MRPISSRILPTTRSTPTRNDALHLKCLHEPLELRRGPSGLPTASTGNKLATLHMRWRLECLREHTQQAHEEHAVANTSHGSGGDARYRSIGALSTLRSPPQFAWRGRRNSLYVERPHTGVPNMETASRHNSTSPWRRCCPGDGTEATLTSAV